MFPRLLTIGSALVSLIAAFGIFTTKAEASHYYDESYDNRPVPCYQYNAYGHCAGSGNRYRTRTSNRYYNGSVYGNQYPYGYTNYTTGGYYRPVNNYYGNSRNNGCYWYYGTYRCDRSCNH